MVSGGSSPWFGPVPSRCSLLAATPRELGDVRSHIRTSDIYVERLGTDRYNDGFYWTFFAVAVSRSARSTQKVRSVTVSYALSPTNAFPLSQWLHCAQRRNKRGNTQRSLFHPLLIL